MMNSEGTVSSAGRVEEFAGEIEAGQVLEAVA
jgi:hypothetical protein